MGIDFVARALAARGGNAYIPVKGVDYFTDAEKQEIAEEAAKLTNSFQIIDVVELPKDNIDSNSTYRVLFGTFVLDKLLRNDSSCYIVSWNSVPGTAGKSVLSKNNGIISYTGYYNILNNTVYGYFDDGAISLISTEIDNSNLNAVAKAALKAALKLLSTGWKTMEEILSKVGAAVSLTWGGIVSSVDEITNDNALYLQLSEKLFSYKHGEWITNNSGIGMSGTGIGAEIFNDPDNIASGNSAHAEGKDAWALGDVSHAEGYSTEASGSAAHAEGESTVASGRSAHAEGNSTEASGENAHAEGIHTVASAYAAHAEGNGTEATASSAHAEGSGTKAITEFTHAEGFDTIASGLVAHAEGWGTRATGAAQHVQGKYNAENDNAAFIVGGGYGDQHRFNIVEVDWEGNAEFKGTVKSNGKALATEEFVKSNGSADLSKYALKSTSLSGYGITDAYTKTQTNSQISTSINAIPAPTWDKLQGKPFYDNSKTYIDNQKIDFAGTQWKFSTEYPSPNLTKKTVVYFDNQEYTNLDSIRVDAGGFNYVYIIGNYSLYKDTLEDNGLPFAITSRVNFGEGIFYVSPDNLGPHTISFYVEDIVTIDEKYIPDTIARATPVFDLSDFGMGELVVGGDPQEFECDTTEIIAAMRRGAVGFKIPTDYGTVTIFGPTLEIDGADAPQLTCAFYLEGMFGDVCITATTTTISVVSVIRSGGGDTGNDSGSWLFKNVLFENNRPTVDNLKTPVPGVSYTVFWNDVEIGTDVGYYDEPEGCTAIYATSGDVSFRHDSGGWYCSPDGKVSIRING